MTTLFDKYFPFSTGPGAVASDASWRLMSKRFCPTGVISGYLNQLNVTKSGTTISVDTGGCFIDGYYAESTAIKTFSSGGNAGLMVAQLDHINQQIGLVFNAGEVSPVQTTDTFEIVLATIPAGSGSTLTDSRSLVRNATNLDLIPVHGQVIKEQSFALYGAPGSLSGPVYANFWGSIPFTKLYPNTGLRIRISASAWNLNTINQGIQYGVNLAGTDYDVVRFFINLVGTHMAFSGITAADIGIGLAAGTYTIATRAKVYFGGGTIVVDGNDYCNLEVKEVWQ